MIPPSLRTAQLFLAAGDLQGAGELARQALEEQPDCLDARLLLADSLRRQGQFVASAACLAPLVEAQPAHADARLMLALALEGAGQDAQAAPHYDAAVRLAPGRAEAWSGLGSARLALGDKLGAARAWIEAWRLDGGQNLRLANAVWQCLNEVEARAGESDYAGWIGVGNRLRLEGDVYAAEAAYARALALDPNLPFAASRLGCLKAKLGDVERAETWFALARAHFDWVESGLRLDAPFFDQIKEEPERIAPLEGELAPTSKKLVLLLGSDAAYFRRYAGPLLASIAHKSGLDATVHFHIVNPEADTLALLSGFQTQLAGLDIRMSFERLDIAGRSRNHVNTYYAAARFLRLPELLRHYAAPVLVMDIDAVFLADAAPLLDGADLALRRQQGLGVDPWNEPQASLVYVSARPQGIEFALMLRRFLLHFHRRGKLFGFFDQTAIYSALNAKNVLPQGFTWRWLAESVYAYPQNRDARPEDYVWPADALVGEYKIKA
jgi:Flp pilus assembly protein TadD